MASDSSNSPMILTPESTGTSGPVTDLSAPNSPNTAVKKTRRQTAFYPNMNSSNKPQKPFSRSAAKRESVMALGSIEHLQHYFTKTGLSAKKNPLSKPHHGLVPAIGGLHIPTSPPSLNEIREFQMPPSPAVPSIPRPAFSPHVKTHEVDPESLLPGVIEDVIAVAEAWKLETYKPDSAEESAQLDGVHVDVLEVLKTTTRAVRSTRNYLLSLPDESAGTIRAQFRPMSLAPGRLIKPKSSTNLSASTSSSSAPPPQVPLDPIVLIRRAALEVLTVLRQLEENCRLPLGDDAYDAGSDGGHSRGGGVASSPSNTTLDLPQHLDHLPHGSDPDVSMSFSLVQVQGRYDRVLVWEDEEDSFAVDAEEGKVKKDKWDERLVLGSGWLYKQDVMIGDLAKERSVVGAYLDIVDEVLFEGKQAGAIPQERGWDRIRKKREGRAVSRAARNRRVSTGDSGSLERPADIDSRRISTGMINIMRGMSLSEEPEDMLGIQEEDEYGEGEETIDDDDLPNWAKRVTFEDNRLARAHALIEYFLPADMRSYLAPLSSSHLSPHSPSGSRTAFLSSLSSGQLLCTAYNTCVRKSKKPWGFVSKDGVHDIIALERAATATEAEDGEGAKDARKKLWTFRRTDNLRLWVGALKLRYMMPIQIPSQLFPSSSAPRQVLPTISSQSNTSTPLYSNTPLSSPSRPTFALGAAKKADREPSIIFDAQIVAKKDDGWEDMLEGVLLNWMDRVVDERRVFQH